MGTPQFRFWAEHSSGVTDLLCDSDVGGRRARSMFADTQVLLLYAGFPRMIHYRSDIECGEPQIHRTADKHSKNSQTSRKREDPRCAKLRAKLLRSTSGRDSCCAWLFWPWVYNENMHYYSCHDPASSIRLRPADLAL
jgi:hypothetical protein